jgi:osmotically-inducible protein OsmY
MSDKIIEQDLRETIALDPKGDYRSVSINVRNGTVLLSGQVPSYRKLVGLEILAAETPGVRNVVNRTELGSDAYRPSILVLD